MSIDNRQVCGYDAVTDCMEPEMIRRLLHRFIRWTDRLLISESMWERIHNHDAYRVK